MKKEPVIIRKWKTGYNKGDLIFLFPCEPSDYSGRCCQMWEYVGEHGGGEYRSVMSYTDPVPYHVAWEALARYCNLYDREGEQTLKDYRIMQKESRATRREFTERLISYRKGD